MESLSFTHKVPWGLEGWVGSYNLDFWNDFLKLFFKIGTLSWNIIFISIGA